MFENYKVFNYEYAGRPLKVEVGKVAGLANGSCMISYGETVILACATASPKPRDGIDFLPLSVDYDEKLYAVGRIPGSFTRREGRPGEKAILTSRVIDRPIRPLFPKDLRNDVALTLTVMSVDPDCSPEITAMIGASIALSISDIPWNGPIGGAFVGMIGDRFIINPTAEERKESVLELTVAASEKKVVMIEAGAKEVSDDDMYNAIMLAHEEIKKLLVFINEIIAAVGKPKFDYPSCELDHDMFDKIFDYCEKAVMEALDTDDKTVRDAKMQPIQDDILEKFSEEYPDLPVVLPELIYKIQKKIVRRWLLVDKKRVDGRRMDQIRPLASEVAVLPRTHGSGLFTRGQTQVLSVVTLGPMSDAQQLDGLDDEKEKRYMHHYNMPGYSTGEAKSLRTPGRREIGHGALAERSLIPVLPSKEEFPYAIRVVSEVVSSNGSTSQGSVCANLTGSQPNTVVVPARGGLGDNVELQANTIATVLAQKMGASYRQLYVPDCVSEDILNSILKEDVGVRSVVDIIKKADILVHGVGRASVMARHRRLAPELIAKLEEAGAVGEAFGQYCALDGKQVYMTNNAGLMLQDLQHIGTIIGIAGGKSKAAAILSVIRASRQDILVTDEAAATEILRMAKENS